MARFIDFSLPNQIKEAPESYQFTYKSKVLNNLYDPTSNSKGIIDFSGNHSHPPKKLLQWARTNERLSVPSVCFPSNELLELVATKIDIPVNNISFAPNESVAISSLITQLSEPSDAFLVITPLTPLLDGLDHMTSIKLIDVSLDSQGYLSSSTLKNAFDSARFKGYNIRGILHSLDSNYELLTSFLLQNPDLHVIRISIPREKSQPKEHFVMSLTQMPGSLCVVTSHDSKLLRRCSADFPSTVLHQQFMLSSIKAGCPLLEANDPEVISEDFLRANNLTIIHKNSRYVLIDFSVFAKSIHCDMAPCELFNLLVDHDPVEESLENLVRGVFKGIKYSSWIESNEGSWATENPDAAAELCELIKKGGGNPL
ncbi:hypothetical protein CAPTEDRAFT_207968 [Capitella teleta]|uniref:Uncharacterized protein n=1 Tax=Capitella teleta TaxID=283909 RepID=R7TUH5_CAPTE|nr:hypothetical protein CAPTEDRAFT_207968 [Capitella teleta]|eukprot:ELT97573.1 hypothetical protein CAPTEDRAFT_207968 [Capitella teleta]